MKITVLKYAYLYIIVIQKNLINLWLHAKKSINLYKNVFALVIFFIIYNIIANNYMFNLNLSNFYDYYQFIIIGLVNNIFSDIYLNYTNYPIFLLFSILFFFSSFFSLFALSYLGFYGVFVLNFLTLTALWLSMLPYFISIFKLNNYYYISFGKWMSLNTGSKINFDFLVDNISFSFSFLTLSIAIFVYIYTFAYFRYEPLVDRLLLFLNLFIISMVFLVSSSNLIMLFLGWELIGLTSFFLINFWSTRVGTLKSAFKAFTFNKLSDLFLFFAILLIFSISYNLDIVTFLIQISFYKNYVLNFFFLNLNYIDLIVFSLLICAFIKSAQIGAHIWLPDSMEAPVPASALIHSATLVSAGIFLLLRFSALFELSTFAISLIAVIGSITAFYGGVTAMYQSDTKKILAYSTISHCGFLMVIYTTGIIEYTLLYLYVHGFFKATIFMSVGNVNRFSRNNQDFRKMGVYYKFLPFDCFVCFIGLLNLSGLPFTIGFFIKHLLFLGLNDNILFFYFVFVNCLFGAFAGIIYAYRLLYNVFFDYKKAKKKLYKQSSDNALNSKFYSNTSIFGNIAIISLLFITYFVCLDYIYIYLTKDLNFSNFNNLVVYSQFLDNFNSSKNFLYTISYANWYILCILVVTFFTNWRNTNIKYKILEMLYFILIVCYCFNFFFFSLF